MTVSQKWDKRVGQWHDHVTSAAAFGKVLDGILVLSQPKPSDVCVDLGAGSGFVTTALAPLVASVHAVDISPAMTEALAERGVPLSWTGAGPAVPSNCLSVRVVCEGPCSLGMPRR